MSNCQQLDSKPWMAEHLDVRVPTKVKVTILSIVSMKSHSSFSVVSHLLPVGVPGAGQERVDAFVPGGLLPESILQNPSIGPNAAELP